MNKHNRGWRICIGIYIILTTISFTPLIIPVGQYKPEILGIPYTMWAGFLVTLGLVILTLIGMKVHPGSKEEEGSK